jgi:hypothetical protein
MALDQELSAYARLLPTLLGQIGKYALVKGDDLVGVFDTYEDAVKTGYDHFTVSPFLVKKISPAEQVVYITRLVTPCPA